MKIARTEQRRDDQLTYSIDGDVITINGDTFDFSAIPDGGYVESVPSDWIASTVRREGGEIVLTLIEPYGPPQPEPEEGVDVES